ncbi:MAG: bifunctional nuclease domain-containing protein [Bacteroidota bacterium]
MQKIKLVISGLSYSQTQSGAYALMLTEVGGKRKLPIVIGGFEAQAIAVELEKMKPNRPLTHDLFKSFAIAYEVEVREIVIYNFDEGIFYAKIICVKDDVITEIDSRTSDAIAIGVRFDCPIYTFDKILQDAGTLIDDEFDQEDLTDLEDDDEELGASEEALAEATKEELEGLLNEALDNEDYESASKIRDELQKRTNS